MTCENKVKSPLLSRVHFSANFVSHFYTKNECQLVKMYSFLMKPCVYLYYKLKKKINICTVLGISATVAAAAIEQAQWSQTSTTSQAQQPSSAAANAMAQAQAAGAMGTVATETYTTQQQGYDATSTASYQQQVRDL